ncbi:kinesin-1 heavy chain [Eurytemora carolleeae]|uniref:kinesin-1 heavy chain n=1 Tax=Eurytemora carolleeae TaxID=1294199 RepID=UPI000C75D8BE|nr:kinesin-1 heavy chain [Eurytemora carolleeae]|eukprot:XP_023343483.1 kinesin-1 heavy chain-like [Eurytemora affinis]
MIRIECLNLELEHTKQCLEESNSRVLVERCPEDIQTINSQEAKIIELRDEVAYIKKELIDARSRKAAAEDDLNTVKGTVETLNNNVNALSNEGEFLKEQLGATEKRLQEKTSESEHLSKLLLSIQSQPGQDEKAKVQIEDLQNELRISQDEVKARLNEISGIKDRLRTETEIVQQRDIEIARLNGQVQFVEEEKEILKSRSGDVDSLQAEINLLRNKLNLVVEDLEVTREDNSTLSRELEQQQVLYGELRKMRGMGEELEMLQQAQRDVVIARERGEEAMNKYNEVRQEAARLESERMRLLREIAQLKSGRGIGEQDKIDQTKPVGGEPVPSVNLQDHGVEGNNTKVQVVPAEPGAGEKNSALLSQIGSLKLYEIVLAMLFISLIFSWNPYTTPI